MKKKYNEAYKKGEVKGGVDFYNTIASESDKKVLDEYYELYNVKRKATAELKAYTDISAGLYVQARFDDSSAESEAAEKEFFFQDRGRYEYLVEIENGVGKNEKRGINKQEIYDKAYASYEKHKQAIVNWKAYNDN